ncbi:MAG: hypothetical protein V1849_05290 [Chloroflexota bacterium]
MAIGISYRDYTEAAEVAGRTVAEVRSRYQNVFSIPEGTRAMLNGKVVERGKEPEVKLHDSDELAFVHKARSKMPLLVGALLLVMAVTGGLFAYTYVTATSTLSVTATGTDFAAISENTSSPPAWSVHGFLKGSTGTGGLFDVDTATSGYPGDLVVSVSLANTDQLVKVYRVLSFKLEVYDAGNNKVDVNGDSTVNAKDFVLLTLTNGEANMFITQAAPSFYTIRLVSGFYSSHVWGGGWTSGYEDPLLFAEVAQR